MAVLCKLAIPRLSARGFPRVAFSCSWRLVPGGVAVFTAFSGVAVFVASCKKSNFRVIRALCKKSGFRVIRALRCYAKFRAFGYMRLSGRFHYSGRSRLFGGRVCKISKSKRTCKPIFV